MRGITTRCSAIELQPQLRLVVLSQYPLEVLPLGPPLCESGALAAELSELVSYPRQESNLHNRLRRPGLCPLSYGGLRGPGRIRTDNRLLAKQVLSR
jgi:hypothetical protein